MAAFWALLTVVILSLTTFPRTSSAHPGQIPLQAKPHTQDYEFDPLLHLPGISPYFDAVGFGLKHSVPKGCKVSAASYLIRHSAIYANDDEYEAYIKPFLRKLEQYRGGFEGPLALLNHWKSPIIEDKLEDITPHGYKDAVKVGRKLLKRYPELVPTVEKILTDKKKRCKKTAKAFIKSFPHHKSISMVKFKKPKDGSMNPIIPHKSCPTFSKEPGREDMHTFVNNYGGLVAERLNSYSPFQLSPLDILAMQSLCGYESAIHDAPSKLCPIFSDAEWMSYEYAWDLRYAHMVGPLNPLSPYLGFPWLQAQTQLFTAIDKADHAVAAVDLHGDGELVADTDTSNSNRSDSDPGPFPASQRLFLAFTHREVPPLIATALGIFNSSFEEKHQFPTDHVVWTRAWKMSDLIPFLGHVGLEKLTCEVPGRNDDEHSNMMHGKHKTREFVRVVANSAPRPISRCQIGPGASCPLDEFVKIIDEGSRTYGDWKTVCGLK